MVLLGPQGADEDVQRADCTSDAITSFAAAQAALPRLTSAVCIDVLACQFSAARAPSSAASVRFCCATKIRLKVTIAYRMMKNSGNSIANSIAVAPRCARRRHNGVRVRGTLADWVAGDFTEAPRPTLAAQAIHWRLP